MTYTGSPSVVPNKLGSAPIVLAGGLATTVLALAGVWWLTLWKPDVNVMGWYLDYVLPAGAILVGIAASSGYALASWLGGVRISGRLLVGIFALQVAAYFGASWIDYVGFDPVYDDGTPVGFWAYFDWTARSFAWLDDQGNAGQPLGVWGYAFKALEIAGFSLGSLAGPAALRGKAYCEACSRYMRSREAAVFAASVPAQKVAKKDLGAQQAHEAEQQGAYQRGLAQLDELHGFAEANDATRFRDRLKELEPLRKAAHKLPVRIQLALARCPRCEAGELRAQRVTGHGKQMRSEELTRGPLPQFFVRNASS